MRSQASPSKQKLPTGNINLCRVSTVDWFRLWYLTAVALCSGRRLFFIEESTKCWSLSRPRPRTCILRRPGHDESAVEFRKELLYLRLVNNLHLSVFLVIISCIQSHFRSFGASAFEVLEQLTRDVLEHAESSSFQVEASLRWLFLWRCVYLFPKCLSWYLFKPDVGLSLCVRYDWASFDSVTWDWVFFLAFDLVLRS